MSIISTASALKVNLTYQEFTSNIEFKFDTSNKSKQEGEEAPNWIGIMCYNGLG